MDFNQNFSRGSESGEICFSLLEIRKTIFFFEIFKIQGHHPAPSPSNANERDILIKMKILVQLKYNYRRAKLFEFPKKRF